VTEVRADDVRVVDDPVAQRYEARIGDRVVGFTEYRRVGGRLVFIHTEVDPDVEGKGIGGRLAAGALDDVRAKGMKFGVKCPFITAYLRRHHEYDDLRVERG
jgi:predicted GNAT family acetyltransferase